MGPHAAIAQLVEQRTFNPKRAGSSPAGGTRKAQEIWAFVILGDARDSQSVPSMSQDRRMICDMAGELRPPTGHVFRVERASGPVWYAKYRLPDGRQIQKKLGPAWSDRGRPAAGYFTKRQAEVWLQDTLAEARRGTLPGMVRTGATFADAAAEWLRFIEEDRARKPSTLRDYRSALKVHLLPVFGDRPLESITDDDIEEWRRGLSGMSNRMKNKLIIQLHGIFRRARSVYKLPTNPVALIEKHPIRASGDIQVFAPEEVWALVRAAANETDAAIYLTAAFTGLRMGELLALRWREVDFVGSTIRVRTNYAGGQLTTPKSGKVRSVPLAPDVASALARLGDRGAWTGDDDLVFASAVGSFMSDAALRPRYKSALRRAGLRVLRFHDLRHTFGTRMIAKADIRRVQEWMGHADIQTTMKYLHYAPHPEDARLVAEAFAVSAAGTSSDILVP